MTLNFKCEKCLDVGQIDTTTSTETNSLPPTATKHTVLLDLDTFRADLKQLANDVGGNAELGRRLGVTGQYIDFLIKGKRKPGRKLFKAIGARPKLMIEIDVEAE